MKNKIGLFLMVVLAIAFVSCSEPNDEVTVVNFPAEKTFPAPETVTRAAEGPDNTRLTWSPVPHAVQYIIYLKDYRNNMIECIPTDIKYTSVSNNTLYVIFTNSFLNNLLLNHSNSYQAVLIGVCAVSYNGVKSAIKFNNGSLYSQ
jgi:hypothetical protein